MSESVWWLPTLILLQCQYNLCCIYMTVCIFLEAGCLGCHNIVLGEKIGEAEGNKAIKSLESDRGRQTPQIKLDGAIQSST